MNDWTFNGRVFSSEDIGKYFGFVYLISDLVSGKKYIGRKYFHTMRKVKGKLRRSKTESDWKKYWGSSTVLQDQIKLHGEDKFKREILALCLSKGAVNYTEIKLQFELRVLESDVYYNDNINGKWFNDRVQKYIKENQTSDLINTLAHLTIKE